MTVRTRNSRDRPRVLMVGYNGANNTGAEALLLSDVADVRAVLGSETYVTIPAVDESSLQRYLQEGPYLDIFPMPMVFPLAAHRLVRAHDLILLVEGSTYMDTWTSALLWYFMWATHCAHIMGKPCMAYAVDAGEIHSALNRRWARREANKTGLIVTRSQAAADRLRSWGVTTPIETTADNAFVFSPNSADEGWVRRVWPEAASGIAGLAVVDFYRWPVVVRPWGRREDCYRWPYYYSSSPERSRATAALAQTYARLADWIVAQHRGPVGPQSVALICMEQLDEPLARQVLAHMAHATRARVFSSREHNASQMTMLLRSLDVLMTSRYHACVLSMAAQVPQLAVGHDLRLKSIYAELGLQEGFFVDPRTPDLYQVLRERMEQLLADPAPVRELLRRGYEEHRTQARRNRVLLRAFVQEHGWEVAA